MVDEDRITSRNPFKFSMADRYAEREGIPLFSVLELTTTARCTRTCSFCPRGEGWRDESGGELKLRDARGLVEELAELGFSGLLILSGLGEPMSHRHWRCLADCLTSGPWKSQLITNGDYLRSADQVKMFDLVCVSLYDGPHQEEKFADLLDGLNYELRRRYTQEFLQLSNRAGWMSWKPRADMKEHPCNYPMYQLSADHDGRAFLCCHDWSETNLGNIFSDGVWSVWTGARMRAVREVLFVHRHMEPCRSCDVTGVLSGDEHKRGWRNLYRQGVARDPE